MTRTLLVAGTASHVGKSTVATGLCRLLSDRGVDVAPFKGQNMSNNARAVPKAEAVRSDGEASGAQAPNEADALGDMGVDETDAFGEVGVSQYVQARAARVRPTTDCNPVLLKPRGEGESQLVVDGEAVAHYSVGEYYDRHWSQAREAAEAAYRRLAASHDVIVAEGAGSIAEINLHDRDIANVETARFADADLLLVADIERGGVFASLLGTLELMPPDLRDRAVGAVVTKFRGDRSLLRPGIDEFETRTGVPVLGVLPYDDPGLPEEDSVALPAVDEHAVRGGDDGVSPQRAVTVAVPRLPRISNFTDLDPLALEPGVRVSYRPPDADFGDADALVLPGTKNTVDDLLACRDAGFDREVRSFGGPVVGLCGGYQLLGERIRNADLESADLESADLESAGLEESTVEGFGLLPVETVFSTDKRVVATELYLDGVGPLAGASGRVRGYEIHMGETRLLAAADLAFPFSRETPAGEDTVDSTGEDTLNSATGGAALGAARGPVLGTYLHGLFENSAARDAFVDAVYEAAGVTRPERGDREPSPYDRAAGLIAEHVDLDPLAL